LNLYPERDIQTHAIIGAAMEVHGILGNGFLEAVYQEAMAVEFQKRGISYAQQVELPVFYKENKLQCSYRVDFICFKEIIVELKALAVLGASEQSQVLNYLKASGNRRGLLLNFGSQSLQYKRIVL
jgi:GxxExxY protein